MRFRFVALAVGLALTASLASAQVVDSSSVPRPNVGWTKPPQAGVADNSLLLNNKPESALNVATSVDATNAQNAQSAVNAQSSNWANNANWANGAQNANWAANAGYSNSSGYANDAAHAATADSCSSCGGGGGGGNPVNGGACSSAYDGTFACYAMSGNSASGCTVALSAGGGGSWPGTFFVGGGWDFFGWVANMGNGILFNEGGSSSCA